MDPPGRDETDSPGPAANGPGDEGEAAALDQAAAAVAEQRAADGAPLTARQLSEAREKAQALVEAVRRGEPSPLADVIGLMRTMSMHAVRACFMQLVERGPLRGDNAERARQQVRELIPEVEVGCMRVDFRNELTQARDTVYIRLDECAPGHDFGAQVDRVRPAVSAAQWKTITGHISQLVNLCRALYAKVFGDNPELVGRVLGRPLAECAPFAQLGVDLANTTLHVDAGAARRVGVFVSRETEGPPARANPLQ